MKFYVLHSGYYDGVRSRLDLLKAACDILHIEFIALNSLTADYSNLPTLTKNDLPYNATRGNETLETLLLNKEVVTFYINNPDVIFLNRDSSKYSILHDKAKLPAPKTIYNITTDRNLLQKYIIYLGGFPIIIKKAGSSRGIGTIKIESWHSLLSTVDYLVETNDNFIMREFIEAKYGARVMVIGKQVVSIKKFLFQKDDFRNAPILSATHYEFFEINDSLKDLCINAVQMANLEMAGVDLIFDKDDNGYLLEINFPTGFQSFLDNPQPILLQMLHHLITKSQKH